MSETVKVQLLHVMRHKFSGSFLLCSALPVYLLSRSTSKPSDQAPPFFSTSYQCESAKTTFLLSAAPSLPNVDQDATIDNFLKYSSTSKTLDYPLKG